MLHSFVWTMKTPGGKYKTLSFRGGGRNIFKGIIGFRVVHFRSRKLALQTLKFIMRSINRQNFPPIHRRILIKHALHTPFFRFRNNIYLYDCCTWMKFVSSDWPFSSALKEIFRDKSGDKWNYLFQTRAGRSWRVIFILCKYYSPRIYWRWQYKEMMTWFGENGIYNKKKPGRLKRERGWNRRRATPGREIEHGPGLLHPSTVGGYIGEFISGLRMRARR